MERLLSLVASHALAPSRIFESSARQQSARTLIAGVDEAGVGTIAGPLVAAAVLLPQPILITSACTVDETCDPIGEVSALIEWHPRNSYCTSPTSCRLQQT